MACISNVLSPCCGFKAIMGGYSRSGIDFKMDLCHKSLRISEALVNLFYLFQILTLLSHHFVRIFARFFGISLSTLKLVLFKNLARLESIRFGKLASESSSPAWHYFD